MAYFPAAPVGSHPADIGIGFRVFLDRYLPPGTVHQKKDRGDPIGISPLGTSSSGRSEACSGRSIWASPNPPKSGPRTHPKEPWDVVCPSNTGKFIIRPPSTRPKLDGSLSVHREKIMSPYQDWHSVWPGPRTFHPSVVPLPIRQGYIKLKTQVIPEKHGNVELMKIPNFLHLTPPVVKKQCEAIKKFCTPFPKGTINFIIILDPGNDTPSWAGKFKRFFVEFIGELSHEFPITVITSTYLNASSSIRDHRARIVILRIPLRSLRGTPKFQDKLKRLLRHRYDPVDDSATLVTDVCPFREQNMEYASYLLTALFHESRKVGDRIILKILRCIFECFFYFFRLNNGNP